MTTVIAAKEIMIYNLEVEYAVDTNVLENSGKLVPVFRMYFGVEDPGDLAEFIHDAMFKFANLTISVETQEEGIDNG